MKTSSMASPLPIKTRFAIKFLQAMKKLNKNNTPPSSSRYKRYRAVRAAARASMASAVGPRRAWSRAVLLEKKNKTKRRGFLVRGKPKAARRNPRSETLGYGEEDDLRRLVPGGRGMEFCSFLSETAHYIKCLRAQVQVMTNILDHFSTI